MKFVRNLMLSGLMAAGSMIASVTVQAQSPENHNNVPNLGRQQVVPLPHPDTVPGYSHPVPGAEYRGYGYGYGYPGAYFSDEWRERQWREAQLREQESRDQELRELQRLEARRRFDQRRYRY